MLKAIYVDDCQYDFVDSQNQLIFSFKSCNRITFLDIRKMQLASMIKGAWCESQDVAYYLSVLHRLNATEVGRIVNFFELFDFDSEKFINSLPTDVWETLALIAPKNCNFSNFFIDGFGKNDLLSLPLREFFSLWSILERQGIHSVSDLIHLTKSELLALKYIDTKRANEIEKVLETNGLHLKKEIR